MSETGSRSGKRGVGWKQKLEGVLRLALGLAVLAGLQHAGALAVQWLGLPVPQAIAGMVLLFVVLAGWGRLAAWVEPAGMLLLQHMVLFFIPAVAGVMEQAQALRAGWLPFVVASVAGAALTLAVTALTLQALIKRQEVRP